MAEYKGVDVSEWQETIDWEKVKAAGIQFAMCRAGRRTVIDACWKRNAAECNRLGIPLGCYWFSYAKTVDDAIAEAKACLAAVKDYDLTYPIAYDYEGASLKEAQAAGADTSNEMLVKLAEAFLGTIEDAGYYAINYTNLDFRNNHGHDKLIHHDLWLAQYYKSHETPCGIWQYSSSGTVPGIVGRVDMDVSYRDYPTIIKNAGLNGHEKSSTKTTKTETAKTETKQAGVTADDVIAVMTSWVGKNRADGSHKEIIDLYNTQDPLPVGYRVQYDDSYCDTGLTAAFLKLDALDLIGGGECGVERHVKLFQAAGIWEEDGTITPARGDIIVYNWDDSSQPNDGFADHIGLIEYVSGGQIHTVECNMNGGRVDRRTLAVGSGYIRGFAHPKYAASSQTKPTQTETFPYGKASDTTGVIKRGSSGSAVMAIQYALNKLGYGNSGTADIYGNPDGKFGTKTESAVMAFQQAVFPSDRTEWDGKVGDKTRKQFKAKGY